MSVTHHTRFYYPIIPDNTRFGRQPEGGTRRPLADQRTLDLDDNTWHDSATLVNARIALASINDTWTIALIGKNLTDEET